MRWTTIHNFPSSLVNWQTDKQTKPNNQPTSVKTCTPWLLQCTLYFRNSKVSAAAKNIIKMQVVNAWRLTQTSRTFSVSGAWYILGGSFISPAHLQPDISYHFYRNIEICHLSRDDLPGISIVPTVCQENSPVIAGDFYSLYSLPNT